MIFPSAAWSLPEGLVPWANESLPGSTDAGPSRLTCERRSDRRSGALRGQYRLMREQGGLWSWHLRIQSEALAFGTRSPLVSFGCSSKALKWLGTQVREPCEELRHSEVQVILVPHERSLCPISMDRRLKSRKFT